VQSVSETSRVKLQEKCAVKGRQCLPVFGLVLEGAGLAMLVLANYIWPQLSPSHLAFYHDAHPTWTVPIGLAIDMVGATVVFAIALLLFDRYRPQQTGPLWSALLALFVLEVVDFVVLSLDAYGINVPWSTSIRQGALFASFAVAMGLSYFFPGAMRKGIRAARFGLAIIGCCIFWMLPGLVMAAGRANGRRTVTSFNRNVPPPSTPQERVIWILFDELSYDQVYEHRQPTLKLPYFDELKNESVVFSDLQPEGYYTERILPALFIGRRIDDIRSSTHRDLSYHDAAAGRWERFDQQATVFGEAKRLGWTTGLAGWYNPYCHILDDVLDSCYWQSIVPFEGKVAGAAPTVGEVMAAPFEWPSREATVSLYESVVKAHTQEYLDLAGASDSLVKNEGISFVFLHLSVPHPVGIYKRKTGKLGVVGSYIDNLALTDKALATLLATIQGTAAAQRTILIISSDHSWRINTWRGDSLWTNEDQRASGGKFDTRPFLLVRFPGSETGEMRGEALPELATNGILSAMLKGEIKSPSDLDAWLSGREAGGRWNSSQTGY
jgi:hypothetical protein